MFLCTRPFVNRLSAASFAILLVSMSAARPRLAFAGYPDWPDLYAHLRHANDYDRAGDFERAITEYSLLLSNKDFQAGIGRQMLEDIYEARAKDYDRTGERDKAASEWQGLHAMWDMDSENASPGGQ